jgi:hypothetical protein
MWLVSFRQTPANEGTFCMASYDSWVLTIEFSGSNCGFLSNKWSFWKTWKTVSPTKILLNPFSVKVSACVVRSPTPVTRVLYTCTLICMPFTLLFSYFSYCYFNCFSPAAGVVAVEFCFIRTRGNRQSCEPRLDGRFERSRNVESHGSFSPSFQGCRRPRTTADVACRKR